VVVIQRITDPCNSESDWLLVTHLRAYVSVVVHSESGEWGRDKKEEGSVPLTYLLQSPLQRWRWVGFLRNYDPPLREVAPINTKLCRYVRPFISDDARSCCACRTVPTSASRTHHTHAHRTRCPGRGSVSEEHDASVSTELPDTGSSTKLNSVTSGLHDYISVSWEPHATTRSRDSSVGTATGYGLGDRGVGVPVPVGS
jgi:hypothetical protein